MGVHTHFSAKDGTTTQADETLIRPSKIRLISPGGSKHKVLNGTIQTPQAPQEKNFFFTLKRFETPPD